MKRNGMILGEDAMEAVRGFSEEQDFSTLGRIVAGIVDIWDGKTVDNVDGVPRPIWRVLKSEAERISDIRKARSEAGRKHGRNFREQFGKSEQLKTSNEQNETNEEQTETNGNKREQKRKRREYKENILKESRTSEVAETVSADPDERISEEVSVEDCSESAQGASKESEGATMPHEATPCLESTENERNRHSRFSPPSLQEVQDYCKERNNIVDAETFVNFYESKGWMVGKTKMKSWKAAVRTWEKSTRGTGRTSRTSSADVQRWNDNNYSPERLKAF